MTKKKKKPKVLEFSDRVEIERLLCLGYSRSEIARKIGRGKNTVVAEVRRYGGDAYDAKEAQKQADVNRDKKYKSVSKKLKSREPTTWIKRIENIEMQIEILYDYIKELSRNDKKH